MAEPMNMNEQTEKYFCGCKRRSDGTMLLCQRHTGTSRNLCPSCGHERIRKVDHWTRQCESCGHRFAEENPR